MSGGLFGRPFVLNIKCIIFSLVCMSLFLINPGKFNKYIVYFILFIIFIVAYISMAWYDFFYNCSVLPFKRGKYGITGLFKPPPHNINKQVKYIENDIDIKKKHLIIYWSHILVIVPLIGYLAIKQNKSHKSFYILLGVIGIFTLIYHGLGIMTSMH